MFKKGLALAAIVALFAVGCASVKGTAEKPAESTGKYIDGTYEGKTESHGGEMVVTVVVKAKKIASVVIKASDTAGISDAAIEKLPGEIVAKQTAEVDAVAGASETSEAIKKAVAAALEKATPPAK